MPRRAAMTPRRARRPAPSPSGPSLLNRQLSWLAFNERVLAQALDPGVPLVERLNFLAITASNLDEFFLLRVGGVLDQAASGSRRRDRAGFTPRELLGHIAERVRAFCADQQRCLAEELLPALRRHGLHRLAPDALEPRDAAALERHFVEELFPALTPVAGDREALAGLSGLRLHLAFRLTPQGRRRAAPRLALVPLPRAWPRFVRLPADRGARFLLLEDVVRAFASRFFEGFEVAEAAVVRVTRNADLPLDEEDADDLLEAVEQVVRARHRGAPVRLEVEAGASDALVAALSQALRIDPAFGLFRVPGLLDLKPLAKLASFLDDPALRYPPFAPQSVPALGDAPSPWEAVRRRDVLLHHPYDTFDPVVALVREAAADPQVLAIKQTLYRTGPDSPIIAALEEAALQGKQVTVLVELKARFDEAQNVAWARRLAEAGVQVAWGVLGLKTHAKMLLIVRREADGVRRYVHTSTGNYNEVTARLYEDFGLLTCDPDFGADASNFFNALTGYSEPRDWRALAVAPTGLRQRLYRLIDREMAASSSDLPGAITLKLNALTDLQACERLYAASQRGVRVRLCVRGPCCLKPGVSGLSENIEVVSIVGRFLEHSRIYAFANGGSEEVYLSSADLMPRNLDRRLEAMFPVRDEGHRRTLLRLLETLFADNQQAWRLGPDGRYVRRAPLPGEREVSAQRLLMEEAVARSEELRVRRISSFRPRGPAAAPGARR